MSKKKTSKNSNMNFDMQIFNDDKGDTSTDNTGNENQTTGTGNENNTTTTTPTTPTTNSGDTGSGSTTPLMSGGNGQSTIVGGGGSMEDGGDVDDDESGGEDQVEAKTFLETLIPGKTESEIIQETPMPAQTFDIAKTRPTLANQIRRANNAAKTTFNYLPY